MLRRSPDPAIGFSAPERLEPAVSTPWNQWNIWNHWNRRSSENVLNGAKRLNGWNDPSYVEF